MTLPKFLSPVHLDRDGWIYILDAKGEPEGFGPSRRDAVLAERGQRPKGGVWPDGFGVVELEDIPKPAPLPAAYYWRHWRSGLTAWDKNDSYLGWTLVATITFDEDGNPHREDHQ